MQGTAAIIHLALVQFAFVLNAQSQAFVNRDFEQAVIAFTGADNFQIDAAKAFPNWTVTVDGAQATAVWYNTISLSGGAVSLQSKTSIFPSIAGNYSVILQDINYDSPTHYQVALSHMDTLDSQTQSLLFQAHVYSGAQDLRDLRVSFSGQRLNLFEIAASPGYNTYGADISMFAGKSGTLEFEPLNKSMMMLDSITFSSTIVPEPPTEILLVCGGALLLGRLAAGARS